MANYDIIGNIVIMKFDKKTRKSEKLKQAKKLLKRKNVRTVLEKTEKVKGRLRTLKTRFLAGGNVRETIHKENNCQFKVNVEKCYFSPRLSEERKEIAGKIKNKDEVLVMFAGVNPFGIVIAKSSGAKVVAIEIGRECCKYAKINALKNKVSDKIGLIQGDVKKVIKKRGKRLGKFSVVVMPRPNLRETFLQEAFLVCRKGTRVFYYCFGQDKDLAKSMEEIYKQAKKSRKKIKIHKVKKAGEIAPYTFRYRVDFEVL